MGKETVYFKETREKAITKKDRRDDINFKRSKFTPREASKNISKKDADVVKRNKFHARSEKMAERTSKASEVKQLHGKSLQDKRAQIIKEIEEKKRSARKTEGQAEEWEDVDEHEKEVFQTTGYFDVPDVDAQISLAD